MAVRAFHLEGVLLCTFASYRERPGVGPPMFAPMFAVAFHVDIHFDGGVRNPTATSATMATSPTAVAKVDPKRTLLQRGGG